MKEPESADHIKKCNKQGNISSISANGVAGDTVQEHVKKSKGRTQHKKLGRKVKPHLLPQATGSQSLSEWSHHVLPETRSRQAHLLPL